MTINCKPRDTSFNNNYNLKTGLPYMKRTDAEKDMGVTTIANWTLRSHRKSE